jgi:hypothetical protein
MFRIVKQQREVKFLLVYAGMLEPQALGQIQFDNNSILSK